MAFIRLHPVCPPGIVVVFCSDFLLFQVLIIHQCGCWATPLYFGLDNKQRVAREAETLDSGKLIFFGGIYRVLNGLRCCLRCGILAWHLKYPVILVIHEGGNELCFLKMAELRLMQSDLDCLPAFFPQLIVVWSEIVPKVVWQGVRDASAIGKAHRTLNARLSRFNHSRSSVVVHHRQLGGDNSSLMRPNNVHLNDIGLDIFLSGMG